MFRPQFWRGAVRATGLAPPEERQAEHYVRTTVGAKGKAAFRPGDTEQRIAALAFAQAVVQSSDAHLATSAQPETHPVKISTT